MRKSSRIEIYLVDDNPGDVRLTMEALKKGKMYEQVTVLKDGQQVIDRLKAIKESTGGAYPDIILLDLNLPGLSGREVLEIIKQDDKFKHIPVIVLTTSDAEEDIIQSYRHHANCYITKPVDFERFAVIISKLEDFWFSIATIPRKNE
jgi:two-component system, chemotaxis family, response regulator Rcp1